MGSTGWTPAGQRFSQGSKTLLGWGSKSQAVGVYLEGACSAFHKTEVVPVDSLPSPRPHGTMTP